MLGDIVDMLDAHLLSAESFGATSVLDREEGKEEESDTFALAPTHVGLLDELILVSAVLKNASFDESNQRFLGDRKLLSTLARYVRIGKSQGRCSTRGEIQSDWQYPTAPAAGAYFRKWHPKYSSRVCQLLVQLTGVFRNVCTRKKLHRHLWPLRIVDALCDLMRFREENKKGG